MGNSNSVIGITCFPKNWIRFEIELELKFATGLN